MSRLLAAIAIAATLVGSAQAQTYPSRPVTIVVPFPAGGPTDALARVEFMMKKMEEIGHTMGAAQVWRAPLGPGALGAHHEGGTRMGSDPKTSVVNRYGQSWDVPNLFVIGSSTFPTMSGFNPTLTIQALAYMSADAIVNRYKKSPGPLL